MRGIFIIIMASLSLAAYAQPGDLLPQHYFRHTVPPGNYSGLTHIGGSRYAIVDDKSAADGFGLFSIDIDSVTGEINDVIQLGLLVSEHIPNRDGEGIAYVPDRKTVFISGEGDNRILEYNMDGKLTGREIRIPSDINIPPGNYGLEALTYNARTHRFWTTTESTLPQDGQRANAVNGIVNHLRLLSFDDSLQSRETLNYYMDAPLSSLSARTYVIGVSALCALDNGTLLVLEREAFVSKSFIGSWVVNKVYSVSAYDTATPVRKRLVAMWRTRFNLLHKDFANYEGMCIGPRLVDGRQVIVLCADSQNQYGGLLRDWFRTIVLN